MAQKDHIFKNVLIIVYYFPPMGGSGVQRPLKFVKYLRQYGWNPIVLCPEPGAYHTFDESLDKELQTLDVEVIRVKGGTPLHTAGSKRRVKLPAFIENGLRKISTFFWLPDNKKAWIKQAETKALELIKEKDIEAIFATAAPYSNLILAANLKDKTNVPVVMDLRDEWLESHLIKYPTKWHKRKMHAIESQTLQKADVITVINEAYKQSFGRRYPNKDIIVLKQGYDSDDFKEIDQKAVEKDKIIFLYSGLFYGDRNPGVFLESIAQLVKERPELKNKIKLHFQGGLNKDTQKLIRELQLGGLLVDYGYVNHKNAVKNIAKADVLWLIVGHKKNAEFVTVGKMFEYIGSKKPILALTPIGATTNLLEKYGAYYHAEPYDKNGVTEALKLIIEDFEYNKLPIPNEEFIKKYDRRYITGKLVDILNSINNNKID